MSQEYRPDPLVICVRRRTMTTCLYQHDKWWWWWWFHHTSIASVCCFHARAVSIMKVVCNQLSTQALWCSGPTHLFGSVYVPKFLISILPPHSYLSILLFLHAHIRYWWQMDARSPAPSPCLQATGWIFNKVYGLVCTQRRAQRTGGHGDPHNLWIEGGTQYKN